MIEVYKPNGRLAHVAAIAFAVTMVSLLTCISFAQSGRTKSMESGGADKAECTKFI